MKYDYLIVGQGIAGTALAETFLLRGKKIWVIDNDLPNTSSKIAAGICNPITGKYIAKTWQADELFPYLAAFYQALESKLSVRFLYPKAVYRVFQSVEEQNTWFGRSTNPEWSSFLNLSPDNEAYTPFLDNPFGGWETLQSYYINTTVLLDAYKKYLIENQLYEATELDYNDLIMHENYVEWKGKKFERVIFCEGIKALQNPFFQYLPFAPVKGEWLKLKVENFNLQNILNQGVFLLPLGEDTVQVGATYHWHNLTDAISAEARKELQDRLSRFFKPTYAVIEQKAGIRPASKHRRPFVGLHPEYNRLGILNGLGTKGVSLAPYFAKELCDFLEHPIESPLNLEVNIRKFDHLWVSKS